MAATRGPVPKPSAQRRRRNKTATKITEAAPLVAVVEAPEADPRWHPIALRWYESLSRSGQARFYEPSDWASAQYLAEVMSRNLCAKTFSAALFAAVLGGMTELLTTEGARRRARLEIARIGDDSAVPAAVAVIDDYRHRLGAS